MYHRRGEVRITILFDDDHGEGFLDISTYRYYILPAATMNDKGIFEYKDHKIIDKKRPYPEGREWTEKVVRSPVRNQKKFRKEVLKAYDNQCAVCNIKEPALLRAAHIIPVIEDNDDTVNNGICLCVNHEVAFDRGILKITPSGDIIIEGDADIKTDFTKMRFPKNKEYYPSFDKLKHRFYKFKDLKF